MHTIKLFGTMLVVVFVLFCQESRPMSDGTENKIIGGPSCSHYLTNNVCPNTIATTGCPSIRIKQRRWACWYTLDVIPVAAPNCDTYRDPNNPVQGVTCGTRSADRANNNCTIHVACAPF